MSEHIQITRDGAVQIIRMNRADKKNAITRNMYAAMTQALRQGDDDADVRVNVILGVPGIFTSGNDVADFMAVAMGDHTVTEGYEFLLALAEAKKPIISGVDGIAVGIGTTIQFHCDLTFATPRTEFRTPFVDLGLVPEAGSSLLGPLALGRQRGFAMLALGEGLSAEDAKAAGMIYEVVAEADLEQVVLAAAANIAKKPPQALKIARDLVLGDRQILIDRIKLEIGHFQAQLKSAEAREAFTAFMSRKK